MPGSQSCQAHGSWACLLGPLHLALPGRSQVPRTGLGMGSIQGHGALPFPRSPPQNTGNFGPISLSPEAGHTAQWGPVGPSGATEESVGGWEPGAGRLWPHTPFAEAAQLCWASPLRGEVQPICHCPPTEILRLLFPQGVGACAQEGGWREEGGHGNIQRREEDRNRGAEKAERASLPAQDRAPGGSTRPSLLLCLPPSLRPQGQVNQGRPTHTPAAQAEAGIPLKSRSDTQGFARALEEAADGEASV